MATDNALTQTLLIVIAAIVFLPVLMMAVAMPIMGLWGGGHMWNGTGVSWMWALLSIVPLLLILGVGYLLYRGVRGSETNRPDPALEALRAAYARGDLTDEEFETRRERLTRE